MLSPDGQEPVDLGSLIRETQKNPNARRSRLPHDTGKENTELNAGGFSIKLSLRTPKIRAGGFAINDIVDVHTATDGAITRVRVIYDPARDEQRVSINGSPARRGDVAPILRRARKAARKGRVVRRSATAA